MALESADRALLLSTARDALAAHLRGEPAPDLPTGGAVGRRRGAFVTVRVDGELRGCRGRIREDTGLGALVAELAVASATRDRRFPPVTAAELPRVRLSVQVLGTRRRVSSTDDIELGRHGIVLSKGEHRAVFLPNVATEHGWDREQLLARLTEKAGLPRDAWRADAKIEVFF